MNGSLLLAPHNDDETLFASYLCLMHKPHVVVCLRSMRMADPNYPGGMPIAYEIRERETQCAMEVLGCTWEQWMIYDNYPLSWERALEEHMQNIRPVPEHVFAPAPELGGHEQHNTVGEMARRIFGAGNVTHYLTYTAKGRSTNDTPIECPVGWLDIKRTAMACYASQAAHPATRTWFEQDDLREFAL
ncbi:MAG: GlcNAc-PI de-N-acetylase [Gaiellaceae bacterium]|nr:GlcNAc-PI de-N-acetylase [Gaiellaceae bacterium]